MGYISKIFIPLQWNLKNVANMINIRTRKIADKVLLSLRVKGDGYDNAIALGISMNEMQWQMVSHNLKTLSDAYKSGSVIYINDQMTSRLWELIQEMTAMETAGTLKYNKVFIADTVRNIIHRSEISQAKVMEKSTERAGKPSFLEFIAQYIAECESGERLKQKSTRKVTAGTIKNYKGFLSKLEEYQKSRKRVVDWDDLDFDFYRDYKQFFIELRYSPNTIARHIKNMKTMLYAAKDLHLTTRDDFMSKQWSADKEEVDNVYIPVERLREMYDFDMMDYKSMKQRVEQYAKDATEKKSVIHALKRDIYRQKLTEARDIFVIGCLTGQRISDYKRISSDMIETIQGDRQFVHLVQVKTGKDVYVPYNDMIKAILDKYDGRLPKVHDQHLNERIKVIGLLLGWTESAGLTERKGVMSYASQKRFCDALATHTARRTFATNAYKAGVPLSAIMAVTGHASEEMLRRYLKLNTKERAMLAAEEFEKVKFAV